jgi:hypothetical protein
MGLATQGYIPLIEGVPEGWDQRFSICENEIVWNLIIGIWNLL